jgi:hypothetical protein
MGVTLDSQASLRTVCRESKLVTSSFRALSTWKEHCFGLAISDSELRHFPRIKIMKLQEECRATQEAS